MAAKKFTFKYQPRETGLSAVAHYHRTVDIKLNKKIVGRISPPNAFSSQVYKIIFMILDENDASGWRNATLKATFATEQEAKDYLQEKFEALREKFKFRELDPKAEDA